MPLYEYQCDGCDRRFEVIRKFSDPPLTACPSCGAAVRKLFSSPAFQFKGSGFYITDYPKKDQPGAGKTDTADNADKTESAKSDSPKTDTAKTDTAKTDTAKSDAAKTAGEATGDKKTDKTKSAASSTPSTNPSSAKD